MVVQGEGGGGGVRGDDGAVVSLHAVVLPALQEDPREGRLWEPLIGMFNWWL